MRNNKFATAIGLLIGFVLWTVAISYVDVRIIGPLDSSVGFAGFNQLIYELTGVHWSLYYITDWLGLVPIAVCAGFGLLGLVQWIKRRGLRFVDRDIMILGGFYIVVILAYLFFEFNVINYRPVLINGYLEASYPSSTTMLTICVMQSAISQTKKCVGNRLLRRIISCLIAAFTAFMVIGRFLSGVHWCTDIIGGILLSTALMTMYDALSSSICEK